MARSLNLCDLDFTDLNSDDEKDVLAPRSLGGGVPPPPPPIGMAIPPPMLPPPNFMAPPVPFNHMNNSSLNNSVNSSLNGSINGDLGSANNTLKKNKKTVGF